MREIQYASPMTREDWNECKRIAGNIPEYFNEVWGWDITASMVSCEVNEVDEGLAVSAVYSVAGKVYCITVFGREFPGVFGEVRRVLFGHAHITKYFESNPKKLGIDSVA